MQPDRMRLAAADEPEEDAGIECCPACGSTDIVPYEWRGTSGVVSPDGYEEPWVERGIKCLRCGAIEQE
jgi:hypothetical protein